MISEWYAGMKDKKMIRLYWIEYRVKYCWMLNECIDYYGVNGETLTNIVHTSTRKTFRDGMDCNEFEDPK